MAKIRFHKLLSIVVLLAAGAWVVTGEFSSVGSAAQEAPEGQAYRKTGRCSQSTHATVSAIAVPQVDHRLTIRISGLTAADKRAELATRAAGTIASLPFKQGDQVKTGDVILSLDANEKKDCRRCRCEQVMKQRQAEFTATESLFKRGNVAKLALDGSRSALQGAQSAFEEAKAELERTQVIAPFDGIVDKINFENGAAVGSGMPAATLIALDPIIATGEVSERNLSSIKIGSPAIMRLVDGREEPGTVRYISREANAATRTYRIEVAIENKDGLIPSGMTAEIDLMSDPVKVIKLPRSALTLNADGMLGVRAVDKDSKVVFLAVDLIDDATDAIVLTGVPEGTKIIVTGQDFVADGEIVHVVDPDAETLKKIAEAVAKEMQQ